MEKIVELLQRDAALYPDKTAAADRNTAYTFAQLKRAAGRIGAQLADRFPGGEPFPVGVVTDRSAAVPLTLLSVAVGGGFYVPLNPEYPAETLADILEDAGISLVIGAAAFEETLRGVGYGGTYLPMAELVEEALNEDGPELFAEAEDERPLVLIYTSGSTGKPKGVLKSHGSMRSFLQAYTERFNFCAEDVIGNQTPFSFDASAKDLYLMLAVGATLQVLPTELFSMPTELIDYLNERRVTVAQWVPTVLAIVSKLRVLDMVKPETLRMVLFVGETMPMKHLNRWRVALPRIRFVNLYGASELAGICCAYEVEGTFADDALLPLGTTLSNCRLYLMKDGQPVTEPGTVGELYLQSPALALEYFKDPARTEAAFFMADLGDGTARTFKTGDLAQLDENGALRFISRADSQFKHLGYRIEAGEIEAAAGALEGVMRCCCLYDEKKLRIVLFCECAEEAALTGRDIIELLRNKLPYYMLPGRVNILPAMPIGSNGKVDRQKLKAMLKG